MNSILRFVVLAGSMLAVISSPVIAQRGARGGGGGATAMGPAFSGSPGDAWWRHVSVLANDSMRGRQTGSPEHRKAAQYVSDQFRRIGLDPVGKNYTYFQEVAFIVRSIDESKSSLTLSRNGQDTKLTLGQDASFVLRAPLAPKVDAAVVFAGYGISIPDIGHDDLSGLDVKGKVVAYISGTPKGMSPSVVSHARAQAWLTFKAKGAVGMITFSGSPSNDSAYIRSARNRLSPQMTLADKKLDHQVDNKLSLTFNAARAELLFAGAPERYAALVAKADSGLPLPRFDLGVRIRSEASIAEKTTVSDNVVGMLRANDPMRRNELVVLTAHLDHLGVGAAVNGDSIYNGAMDNAAGVAMLIETAQWLSRNRGGIRRTIVFVAVTGEEKGLLGSRYYAHNPIVPATKIVANLNTDMFLPIIPTGKLMVNGLEESDLADDIRRAGSSTGVAIIPDPEPEEGRFTRSDQYSFILRGIPSLSVKIGFDRDSPEHDVIRKFRAERYHQPSDDLMQPVDREAAAKFLQVYGTTVKFVAGRETRPAWLKTSFFKRFE